MAIFENFPYTNFHDLNLDWILQKMREMGIAVDAIPKTVSSEVEKQLEDANLNQIVYNALTTYGLVVNVKAPPEGLTPAVGDGVADDTEAIQACITYAGNHDNKIVFFPSGTYKITSTLEIKKNSIALMGFDALNTQLTFAGEVGDCIKIGTAITRTFIYGLQIIGSTTATIDTTGITYTVRGYEIEVANAIIKGVTVGFSWSTQAATTPVTLRNVRFENITTAAIESTRQCKLIIDGCTFPSATNSTESAAIDIEANNAQISNIIVGGAYLNGVVLNGNNCTVTGDLSGAINPYVDNGTGNNIIAQNITSINTPINASEIDVEDLTAGDIHYKNPVTYNSYFKTVKMKDENGVDYNVLVEGSNLANLTGGESVARIDFNSTVFFGDSYTQGYLLNNPETESFPALLAEKLGCEHTQIFGGGGCGFAHVSGSLGVNFSDYFDSIAIDNPTGVTAFIVQGGWNDKDQIPSDVRSGMVALFTKIKNTCPNAKILFVMNPAFSVLDKNIIRTLTTQAATLGVITIGSSWWWLLGETGLFFSDYVHPNANGHSRIANALYAVLMGGVYEHSALCQITAAEGFTLNFYFNNEMVHIYVSGTQPTNTHATVISTVPEEFFKGTTAGYFKTPHRFIVAMGNDSSDQDGTGIVSFGFNDTARHIQIRSMRQIDSPSDWTEGQFQCNISENSMLIFG